MNNIKPEEAQKIIQSGKVVVIDVRTPAEFSEGHIPGARNIDIYNSSFETEIRALKQDEVYVVNCQKGGRSANACAKLRDLGFTEFLNLEGGFDAWKNAGLPVEKV